MSAQHRDGCGIGFSSVFYRKGGTRVKNTDVRATIIGMLIKAEGHRGNMVGADAVKPFDVGTDDADAASRKIPCKAAPNSGEVGKIVGVVKLHRGEDTDGWIEAKERILILTCLKDNGCRMTAQKQR